MALARVRYWVADSGQCKCGLEDKKEGKDEVNIAGGQGQMPG
jgi:hypothetical protein